MTQTFSKGTGASAARSDRPEVRNPVLGLPVMATFRDLPPEARDALIAFLAAVRTDASARGDRSWSQRKYSSAAYWKVVAVYAGHLANALRLIARAVI
jgi:hypothetical protein